MKKSTALGDSLRIRLISVSRRVPAWVEAGFREYAKRLPPACALDLCEIQPADRGRSATSTRLVEEEARRLTQAIPAGAWVVALDERGTQLTSTALAERLGQWMQTYRDVALLVGGAEGLAPSCRERADQLWSLSALTLPHALVRVLVAEQIYRAWSLLGGHPYHRA